MKGITWGRDSHGLFDYESRHLTKKTLKASREVMILRSSNELTLVPYRDARSFQEQINEARRTPEDMAMLKIVNHNKSTFYLESAAYQHHEEDKAQIATNGKSQESMYLVVRSLKINNEKIVSAGRLATAPHRPGLHCSLIINHVCFRVVRRTTKSSLGTS